MRVLTKEIIALVLVLLSVSGCRVKHPDERKVISIKGSDTMVNLVQMWAEEYMKLNPDVSIQVTGGGSGIGIAALINNTTDIAASSRELKEKEKALANENNITYSEINVALASLSIYDAYNPDDSSIVDSYPFRYASSIAIRDSKTEFEVSGTPYVIEYGEGITTIKTPDGTDFADCCSRRCG